jgi:DNA-binding CsgD family transcriptional regulator
LSTHVEHILAKLGVENRSGAVMTAAEILHRA